MKKILLLIILSCIGYLNTHAHIFTGPNNQDISRNSITDFTYQNTTEGVQLFNSKWTVENGTFVNANGSTSYGNTLTLPAATFQRVYVKWNNPNTTGKVTVELAKDNSSTYSVKNTWTVNVLESYTPTPGSKYSVSGKSVISVGETAVYTLVSEEKKVSSWQFNKDYFQKINEDDKTITLKALKHTSPYSNAVLIGKVDADSRGEKIIRIKPTYTIELTGDNIICNNGITSYKIKDIDLTSGATISWEAGNLMAFVSGQGTPTATFQGSGHGKGIVKATVNWNGENYPIENSDVWVGAPMAASGIGFIPNDPIIEMPQETPEYLCINKAFSNKNYIYSQITGGDLISNTEYQWIKKTNNFNLASTTFSKAMVVPTAKGDMIIEYITKNKCGSMAGPIKYIIKATECDLNGNPINSGGGGGVITPPDDFIPMSRSSVEPQPTSIRIYSYPTGSLVYQKKNTISFDIQSTNLGEGIYILEMTDQQGNVTREKVMKGKQ